MIRSMRWPGLSASAVALLLVGCDGATSVNHAVSTTGGTAPQAKAAVAMAYPAPPPATSAQRSRAFVSPEAGADASIFPTEKPNGWQITAEQPVSTFSADVDTASYAVARRYLRQGRIPPADAVRVEEMVNYFPYAYAGPEDRAQPFKAGITVLRTPWNADTKLVHVGLKAWDVAREQRPRANVTFLVDVSGSMEGSDRLDLIKQALIRFADKLRPDDTVSLVTYAGEAGVRLEPVPGSATGKFIAAVERLKAEGSTAGFDGLTTAYRLAERHFDAKAINRIVLATDGDFNVGEANPRRLEEMIAAKRKTGIYLTILGVGQDNLNDALAQRLAQAGNGQAAYLDSALEAEKVLGEQFASTMVPVADDVKVQVEFNPAQVAEYRLIGYETRMLARTEFKDDKVDAGEVGAGHSVTALYEVVPVGSPARHADALRYGTAGKPAAKGHELGFLKLRWKAPRATTSKEAGWAIPAASAASVSDDIRFAVAIAGFGQLLRREPALGNGWSYTQAADLADGARGRDANGWRAEAVQLIRLAKTLGR
ncbi:MAG: VWA domain-containing protein [Magnetospirillum sp.]|nr:VWA domain-containing protein [Magnetospirillum sp.]